jgi:anti-sigma B factor antagonist
MAPSDELPVSITQEDGHVILRPTGEIDLSRAPSFRASLQRVSQQQPTRMIVDLEDVSYMDSSGVATLVEAMQNARKSGYSLILCRMDSRVRSIFEIAKLDVVFKIVGTIDEALHA